MEGREERKEESRKEVASVRDKEKEKRKEMTKKKRRNRSKENERKMKDRTEGIKDKELNNGGRKNVKIIK